MCQTPHSGCIQTDKWRPFVGWPVWHTHKHLQEQTLVIATGETAVEYMLDWLAHVTAAAIPTKPDKASSCCSGCRQACAPTSCLAFGPCRLFGTGNAAVVCMASQCAPPHRFSKYNHKHAPQALPVLSLAPPYITLTSRC